MGCEIETLGAVPAAWRLARGWLENLYAILASDIPSLDNLKFVACGTSSATFSGLWADCITPPNAVIVEMCTPVPQFWYYNGSTWLQIAKHNYTAVVAPTVNDDANDGYVVGSRWIDTVTDLEYICLDSTVGAAVWKLTTVSGVGTGTVTSVGLSMPAEFSVAGSPVTSSGTLIVSKANQISNVVYAGPTIGSAAPTFRALVANDIPNLNTNKITVGTLLHERGGLEADVSAYNGYLRIQGGATSQVLCQYAAVTNPTVNDDAGDGYVVGSRWININTDEEWICLDTTFGAAVWKVTTSAPAGGSVTSVGLAAPAIFSVSGSPVTTAGTLTLNLVNQSANTIWAGPSSGGAAAPAFRALVANDIPWATPNSIGTTTPSNADFTALRIRIAGITHAEFDSTTGELRTHLGGSLTSTYLGYNAGTPLAANANRNVVIGRDALTAITTTSADNDNVAIGYRAGFVQSGGTQNVYIGSQAGLAAPLGGNNTFVGFSAAANATTIATSTIIGSQAALNITGFAQQLVAIGVGALGGVTTSAQNAVAIGFNAAYNTQADTFVAIGAYALNSVTTGSTNIGIGYRAGYPGALTPVTTGGFNILIGYETGFTTATQRSNSVVIGNAATVNQNNAMILGALYTDSTNFVDIGSGTDAPAAKLHLVRANALTTTRHLISILDSETTGTPAAGYGNDLEFRGNSDSTASQTLGKLGFAWSTATHASRASAFTMQLVHNATVYDAVTVGFATARVLSPSTSTSGMRFRIGTNNAAGVAIIEYNTVGVQFRGAEYRTNGVARWGVYADQTAEGGANAGSNFAIERFSDAGGSLGNAFAITRATGDFGFGVVPPAKPTYGAPTGTLTRTTFATGTVTLVQLAERVAAMITDLRANGIFV